MKNWRIILLAVHDALLGVRRREVYRYENGGDWRFAGVEAKGWFASLVLKSYR